METLSQANKRSRALSQEGTHTQSVRAGKDKKKANDQAMMNGTFVEEEASAAARSRTTVTQAKARDVPES